MVVVPAGAGAVQEKAQRYSCKNIYGAVANKEAKVPTNGEEVCTIEENRKQRNGPMREEGSEPNGSEESRKTRKNNRNQNVWINIEPT